MADSTSSLSDVVGSYGTDTSFLYTTPPTTGSSGSGGTVTQNTYDPFSSQRTNALSIIDSIWNAEAGYQNTYAMAYNMLTNGRAVFENAISCDTKLGDPVSYQRALTINANVISNIDRTINYSMTVSQIPWSLPDIEDAITLSNSHVAVLSAAKTAITNATTSDAITDATNMINQTNFNADEPIANLVSDISEWLTSMETTYNTNQCPIDLTSALSGESAPTAPVATSSTVGTGSPTTGS